MKAKNTFGNLMFIFSLMLVTTTVKGQGTTYTPMGQIIYLENNWDTPFLKAAWEADGAQRITDNNWDAVRIGAATSNYNCHSYAWNVTEGGPSTDAWLDQTWNGNPNLSRYWTNDAYIPTSTVGNHEKIFYSSGDQSHSAVTTSTSGKVRSKWGRLPLYEHSTAQCPYNSGDLHYYKLVNPTISGSFGALCTNSQRTFSESSFTNISLNYDWSTSSPLSEVSGDGTSSYIVNGLSQSGGGSISLTITTPSGAISTNTKNIWVDTPPTPEISSFTPFVWATGYIPSPSKEYTVYAGQEINFFDENINTYGGMIQNSDFNWTWSIEAGGTSYDAYDNGPGGKTCIFYEPCSVRIRVKLSNSCGETDWSDPVYVVVQQESLLSLSPNPTSGETTVELTGSTQAQTINDCGWDLEVYDQGQALKAKVSKIKNNSTKIQTSGWKDGVYIVRAKIGNKTISKKLVVKH